MKKKLILSFIGMLTCAMAWCALPTEGKYYRIVNANYTTYSMAENYQSGTTVCTTTGDNTTYQQLWYWNGSTLQNVYTGHYIQAQSSTSSQFKTGTTTSTITMTNESDGHIKIKCGGNTLHCDASKNVVKWEPEAEASHWTFKEVTLTDAELSAARSEYEAFEKSEKEFSTLLSTAKKADYSALSTIFADNACTQLNATYANMTDDALTAAVTAAGLPEQIAKIAVKVKNNWNDELNGSISAQFRVQNYQAYAGADLWRWTSSDGKGLNASQITDMNNPTGIYTTGREVLYVFVDGDIPTGCTLTLAGVEESASGLNQVNRYSGTTLAKGINIIGADVVLSEYWIMYSITNKNLKPADLAKLKIHIEGGNVMGYVDAQGKDEATCNAEYEKILRAANAAAESTSTDKRILRLATKGDYGMFYWQIMTYNRIWSDGSASILANSSTETVGTEGWTSNYKYGFMIWKSMKFFDDVLHQEWGTMGFLNDVYNATATNTVYNLFGGVDLYPTYCNNKALTLMGTNGGNPYSTTGFTHMPGVGAVESSYNGERSDFDVWCVGHESGHNNQGTINLQSSTESSNNLFSNIITYWYGHRMSRGSVFSENEAYYQANTQFSLRDISTTMRMYYQLYLYYHTAGYKRDFYPTLFVNLRADGMNLNSSANSWLKFYKKACEAAQEDLTEFFRMWGFFVPFNNVTFGDYTSYTLTLTQSEIDAAIAEVKAKAEANGWRENLEIMFIDDRMQLRERTDIWAEAEASGISNGVSKKYKPDNGGTWRTESYLKNYAGELGDVFTYAPESIVAGNYTYTVSGTTVTMTGNNGGVGFLLYDAEGNIVAHSNRLSFTIPSEIALNDFTIKVLNADGTLSDCANTTGAEQYREALQDAITKSATYTNLKDATGTKAGYYTPEQLTALEALVAAGKTILENNDADNYLSQYRSITEEMLRIDAEESVQQVTTTGLYTIQNNRTTSRYLSGAATLTTATTKNEQQQWAFIPTGTADTYYLQNVKTGAFLAPNIDSSTSKISNWTVSVTSTADAGTFTLENAGSGSFYIKTNDVSKGNYYLNLDGASGSSVVPWSADAGSMWNIARVGEIEEYTNADLKALVDETESLISTVCDYTANYSEIKGIQNEDSSADYYISSNATTGVEESHALSYLIDGKAATYFSTAGATVKAKRFITLNLGEGNEVSNLRFFFRTPTTLHTLKPTQITVKAGATVSSMTAIATLTDLPSSTTKSETYTSSTLTASKPARVWRFTVDANNNSNPGTYPEFALAQFKFYEYLTTITPKAGYEDIDQTLISTARTTDESVTATLKGETTPLTNYQTYKELRAAYDALAEAAASCDGIESVATTPQHTLEGIYDLSGRHISKVTKSGVYIVNGKKMLIK